MSIGAILHVLNHSKALQSHQTILIRLADHADSQGLAWPSKARLARDTGYGRQWVHTVINDLLRQGEIRLVENAAGQQRFELHIYNTKTRTCTCEGVVLHDSSQKDTVALVDEGVVSSPPNLRMYKGDPAEPLEENLINAPGIERDPQGHDDKVRQSYVNLFGLVEGEARFQRQYGASAR
jgi:hypothetical protein